MSRRERGVVAWIALVFGVCLWRVLALVDAHGVDLVVMDQWDFLVPLFEPGYGWLEKLRFQFHGSPHRMGVGWPLIELVARASGFSTRADGFAIAGVMALAAGLGLVLKRRLSGRLEAVDALIPLLFLTLRQWTTFIGTTDVSLGAMPVLLLVTTGLVLTLDSTRARVASLLVLDLACIYTGFALFAGLVIPTLLVREAWLGRLGARAAGGALGLALVFGLSYFIGFDATPATRPVAGDVGLGDYAVYATNLFASAFAAHSGAGVTAVGLAWPLLLGGPLAWAGVRLARRDGAAAPAVVWLLCGFGLLFVVANAVGRVGEGVLFAYTPRYVTLMLPAVFGLLLATGAALEGRVRAGALVALAAVWLAGEGVSAGPIARAAGELADAKRDWTHCYLATGDLARCNDTGRIAIYPYRDQYPRIERGLAWLEEHELSLFAAGARPEAEPIRNVLLISVDTLRADHLGWHGYARDTTPALSRLARRSVVFEQAMSTSSWTLPAHGSLLTGRYPSGHGAQDDGSRLAAGVPTVAGAFDAAGFHTLAVVSHVYVASPFGFDRGFDVFDDALIRGGTTNPRGDAAVDRLLERLDERAPDAPFFAFLHLYDPHWDYAAPEPWARRFVDGAYAGPIDGSYEAMIPFLGADGQEAGDAMAPADLAALVGYYDGEIGWVDEQLARLVAELEVRGIAGSTLLVLTSDHGEEFREHGRLGHGRTLYEEQLHVPLLLHHASLPPERRREPVSLIDVGPTLFDLAGVPPPAGLPGRSLRDLVPAERVLFAESIRFGLEWRAARRGHHKVAQLAEAGGRAFFDLAADPREQRPLRDDPSGGVLADALDAYAAGADTGWHFRVVAGAGRRVRLAARITSPGRILQPGRYASGRIGDPEVVFHRFEPGDDGHSLEVDLEAFQHTGSIRFETEPPDAPVRLEIVTLEAGGLFAANGAALGASPVGLARSDPRLSAAFAPGDELADGVHVRAVASPGAGGVSPLSEQARRHLEALGYGRE
jgi:arylsulfatase A-like enzyme